MGQVVSRRPPGPGPLQLSRAGKAGNGRGGELGAHLAWEVGLVWGKGEGPGRGRGNQREGFAVAPGGGGAHLTRQAGGRRESGMGGGCLRRDQAGGGPRGS